jgi:hypothetical protein
MSTDVLVIVINIYVLILKLNFDLTLFIGCINPGIDKFDTLLLLPGDRSEQPM